MEIMMDTLMSRRTFAGSAGLLTMFGGAGLIATERVLAQSDQGLKGQSLVSGELVDYLEDSVSLGLKKVRTASFGASDFRDLAKKITFMAQHLGLQDLERVS
jgi:hypothetical protein